MQVKATSNRKLEHEFWNFKLQIIGKTGCSERVSLLGAMNKLAERVFLNVEFLASPKHPLGSWEIGFQHFPGQVAAKGLDQILRQVCAARACTDVTFMCNTLCLLGG